MADFGFGVENAEDFVLTHDQVLFAIHLDVAAGVLAEQDAVADLHIERNHFAVFQALAFADGDYFAFLGLFFGGVGNVQTALHLLLLLNPFDHDAVVERTNFHGKPTSVDEILSIRLTVETHVGKCWVPRNIISTLLGRVTRIPCKQLDYIYLFALDREALRFHHSEGL